MTSLFPPPYETTDRGHGRLEQRAIWTTADLPDNLAFPHRQQAFTIERTTTDLKGVRKRYEVVQCITSLPPEKATPADLLGHNRGHWSIENKLHNVRDVTFDEDRSQVRTGSGPHIMATLRNLAISLLRLIDRTTSIAQGLRSCTFDPEKALRLIGV